MNSFLKKVTSKGYWAATSPISALIIFQRGKSEGKDVIHIRMQQLRMYKCIRRRKEGHKQRDLRCTYSVMCPKYRDLSSVHQKQSSEKITFHKVSFFHHLNSAFFFCDAMALNKKTSSVVVVRRAYVYLSALALLCQGKKKILFFHRYLAHGFRMELMVLPSLHSRGRKKRSEWFFGSSA